MRRNKRLPVNRGWAFALLVTAASFGLISAAAAQTPPHHKATHHHGGHIGYLAPGASERGPGYQQLVGDPDAGVGFYPLPERYREGAWRYHMREASVPPFIRNGVLYAMTMDRYRYGYWWATPADSWRYGVEDPYAGVGTPYFAGFYGPAEGDEDEPAFPFGRPYQHW